MTTHLPRHSNLKSLCPPLENGDRLTRPEFERRYEASFQITGTLSGIEPTVRLDIDNEPSPLRDGFVVYVF